MLVSKKISETKKAVSIAIVAITFLIIGYLLYTNFLAGKGGIFSGALPVDAFRAPAIEPEFNFDFANKFPYSKLRRPAGLPVAAGRLGRPNPFLAVPFFPTLSQ